MTPNIYITDKFDDYDQKSKKPQIKSKKPISITICESNNLAIQSKNFEIFLKKIFRRIYGLKIALEKEKLIKKLINDEKLELEELYEIEEIIFQKSVIGYGNIYFIDEVSKEKRGELSKNFINVNNIVNVLMAKIIRNKVKIILGEDETSKILGKNNSKGKDNDIFGTKLYENEFVYMFSFGNEYYLLNKINKKIEKYSRLKYIYGVNYYEVSDLKGNNGIIDLKGNIIVSCKYSKISFEPNFNGFYCTDNSGKKGVIRKIDGKWKEIIKCKYNDIIFNQFYGFELKDTNGLIGVKDETGGTIFECSYDELIGFAYKIGYLFRKEDKLGVLDSEGNEIKPFEYTSKNLRLKKYIHVYKNKKGETKKVTLNKIEEYYCLDWRDIRSSKNKVIIYLGFPLLILKKLLLLYNTYFK